MTFEMSKHNSIGFSCLDRKLQSVGTLNDKGFTMLPLLIFEITIQPDAVKVQIVLCCDKKQAVIKGKG